MPDDIGANRKDSNEADNGKGLAAFGVLENG